MHDVADRLAGPLVIVSDDLAAEFEARLADSSTLAVRVAFGVLRNRQDAEDVAQDAFVRAYRSFGGLRDREKFRAWLVRMTWRLALDWKRGVRRRVAREDAVAMTAPPVGNAETDVLAAERSTRLWTAIDALPDRLRMIVVLAAIEGHSMKDVGQLLDVPEGTVKSRLFEAKKLLQEKLQ